MPRVEVIQPVDPNARQTGEGLMIGELGLVELKLSKKEEAALSRPAPIEQVRIKPTGQVYLSHPTYTLWFNEAFGRLGWSIVPVGKPQLSGKSVVCPYVLFIHGKPVRFAYGEQEYFEANKDQTYGDALESTVASALRRVAKRLGVGLELWDPAFGEAFVAEHCIQVPCRRRDGSTAMQWRRRKDPKFWNELDPQHARRDDVQPSQRVAAPEWDPRGAPPDQAPPAGHHQQAGHPITDKQRKRLWVIIRNSRRDEEQVRAWLERRFGWTSTKQVTREMYEYVCTAVEAPGSLPERS